MKIKLTRPTVAGALAASLLSVGLVGAWVPAAFAAGLNTETSRLTTGLATVDPLQLSGTAASEVDRIHVLLVDPAQTANPLEFDIQMDATSVAEQNWTQDIALADLSLLPEGPILVTTSFFDVNGVDLEDVPGLTILDLTPPTITSDHISGQVPAGTQVTFATPDADASLFATVSHGGTAAQPDPSNPAQAVTGPITVTDAMQIKVLATDGANDVVQTFNFTVPAPAATTTTTTLTVSPASPQLVGTALTLTASVSPATAPGTFEYFDGAVSLGTGASKSVTPAAGSHSYKAVFTPTNAALFKASTSAVKTVVITSPAAANTATTLSVSPASPQVEGTSLTLTATESPVTPGTFEYFEGATSLGTGTSKSLTPAAGSHSYTAVFTPTDAAGFNASTSATRTVTITAKPVVVVPPVVVPPVVLPPAGVPPVVVPPVVLPPVVVPPVVVPPVVKPPVHVVKTVKVRVIRVSAAGQEYVTVKNSGRISVNLRGYQLRDRSGHVLSLPSYTLKPGSSVKVYTGSGKSAAGKVFLNKKANVWSKKDTASLFNTKGLMVASLRY